jgi:3-hydroxymyristoyl/3-hydroxydecanoyl-(acyl carrier protein) dehydratase
MDGHFRAFSFVDRITRPGLQVRGVYRIPSTIAEFPLALAAEACGQLAAWTAMAAMDFKLRPVAGIAPVIELLQPVYPGQTLELESDLESLDTEAVSYNSLAKVNGVPVLRLQHCVGPMVPVEDFDDPQLLKQRFDLICGAGAVPGAFRGIPPLVLEFTGIEPGKTARGILHVPAQADFFTDHFPRRPVFPGTLFMYKVLELAARVADGIPLAQKNTAWVARRINDSKLRAFMSPGGSLEFEAQLAKQEGDEIIIRVEAKKDNKVTGHSRIVFKTEELA